jgi:hypothetical protein
MTWTGTFEDLEGYLREFANFSGDPVPYDTGGVIILWLALLDNLRQHHIDSDFDDVGEYLSTAQEAFLLELADRIRAAHNAKESNN